MTKTAEFIQSMCGGLANNGGSHFRNVLSHPAQQVAVPCLACGNPLIYVTGNQDKQTLDTGIKAMQIQSHSIKISPFLWGLKQSQPRLTGSTQHLLQLRDLAPNPFRHCYVTRLHNSMP